MRTPPESCHPQNLHLFMRPRSTLRLMTPKNGSVVARHPDSRGGGRAMPKVSRLHFYRPKVETLVPADGAFLCLTLSLAVLRGVVRDLLAVLRARRSVRVRGVRNNSGALVFSDYFQSVLRSLVYHYYYKKTRRIQEYRYKVLPSFKSLRLIKAVYFYT